MNSIICEKRIYTDKNKIHTHSYGQLILPINGKLNIETLNKNLSIGNDSIFFLPPDCEHLFKSNNINEFLVLDIPTNYLKNNDMNKVVGGKEIVFDEKWKAINYLFLNEINNKNSSTSINNLFSYCYDLIVDENEFESIKYIKENYAEDIDLKKLADIEHYNTNYYTEWFKNNMGVSPIEYIQKLRIDKSKDLLLNTDLTILQVGESVGYKYNSTFTRAFKNIENLTPKEFRQQSK